jgi:hypothetical protein
MRRVIPSVLVLSLCVLIAACAGNVTPIAFSSGRSPQDSLMKIYDNLNACIIPKNRSAFDGLAVVPELDTRVGKPRLLIVKRSSPTARPLLVITAEDQTSGSDIEIFGPLLSERAGRILRLRSQQWHQGFTACT